MHKFYAYQRITVLDLLINDIRMDTSGYFIREMLHGPKKGKYLVRVNSTELFVDADKVITEEEHLKRLLKEREDKEKRGN